jgi:hypothetical protein
MTRATSAIAKAWPLSRISSCLSAAGDPRSAHNGTLRGLQRRFKVVSTGQQHCRHTDPRRKTDETGFRVRARDSPRRTPPAVRFHDISAQCPRPFDTVSPARFSFAPCRLQLDRNGRTYEITLANNTKIGRTSDDPGRALLTGFVGGLPGLDDWNTLDVPACAGSVRRRRIFSTTAPRRSSRSSTTTSSTSSGYRRMRAPGIVSPVASPGTSIAIRRSKSARRCSRTCANSRTRRGRTV